jgi:hypothetical protein
MRGGTTNAESGGATNGYGCCCAYAVAIAAAVPFLVDGFDDDRGNCGGAGGPVLHGGEEAGVAAAWW